ncbi:hypothetical protein CHLRE_12g495958v5 [Chlamydomonas reinhardtii]|uniref:Uncharacterized protein n=1 Tax=Chlamydomonas reinhardtii TaxID=3055 RepID=A0A2K3D218_CHLRE|nr:uncharacterized protein CHLRE_12g495958v5 [Chlamydomonas reinhardtii]PNW74580.1 hypothetical protein CHLRE_12g495958v5 [Chlamydomonas reinhardtii]
MLVREASSARPGWLCLNYETATNVVSVPTPSAAADLTQSVAPQVTLPATARTPNSLALG